MNRKNGLFVSFLLPTQSIAATPAFDHLRRGTHKHGQIANHLHFLPICHAIDHSFTGVRPIRSNGTGPLLPARISWFVFESPNLVWSFICWRQRRADLGVANVLLLVLFVLHYLRRAILYPATMSSETKPMPVAVVVSACCYCTFNG
jgi:hypothetical protein